MIALIILGALLFLILFILFLPLNVFISFKEEFYVKVKFAKIKLYETAKKNEQKGKKKVTQESSEKEEQSTIGQSKELFLFLKEKHGFFGAVKRLLSLFRTMLDHIKSPMRHIKLNNIRVAITVSGDDAAATAIEYGKVCSVAYPVLSYIDSFSSVKFKKIDIKSDFAENKKEFEFSLKIKIQIIYLLISAYKIYLDYKNFTLKENYDERK